MNTEYWVAHKLWQIILINILIFLKKSLFRKKFIYILTILFTQSNNVFFFLITYEIIFLTLYVKIFFRYQPLNCDIPNTKLIQLINMIKLEKQNDKYTFQFRCSVFLCFCLKKYWTRVIIKFSPKFLKMNSKMLSNMIF